MHDDELWQVFADNGTPIPGKGALREEFDADKSLAMGNAHVWFWRATNDGVEVMLQKRGPTKRRPGWYHISAAGHINIGETALQAAAREVKEELGLDIDPHRLYFVQATRVFPRAPHDIANVFLYRYRGDEKLAHLDGEVESVEWRSLENFKYITKDPEAHTLVPMGDLYFATLIAAIEQIKSPPSRM